MTNIERIFELFEAYSPASCREHIQEGLVYLDSGARDFSARVRPLDVRDSLDFLRALEASLLAIAASEHSAYTLRHRSVTLDLSQLRSHFSRQAIQGMVTNAKIFHSDARTVLNSANIHSYQRIDEFFDLLQALLEHMLGE